MNTRNVLEDKPQNLGGFDITCRNCGNKGKLYQKTHEKYNYEHIESDNDSIGLVSFGPMELGIACENCKNTLYEEL